MAMHHTGPRTVPAARQDDSGIWILLLGDMVIFGLLFFTYLYYRSQDPMTYLRSQAVLSKNLAAFNTVLLLTGSWSMATAVRHLKEGRDRRTLHLLGFTLVCALGFIGIKITEYGEKIGAGITGATNDFFMFYFVLTGVHFLHVVLATGFVGTLWLRSRKQGWSIEHVRLVEIGGLVWHLVDLLWIVLFPLLYLVK